LVEHRQYYASIIHKISSRLKGIRAAKQKTANQHRSKGNAVVAEANKKDDDEEQHRRKKRRDDADAGAGAAVEDADMTNGAGAHDSAAPMVDV